MTTSPWSTARPPCDGRRSGHASWSGSCVRADVGLSTTWTSCRRVTMAVIPVGVPLDVAVPVFRQREQTSLPHFAIGLGFPFPILARVAIDRSGPRPRGLICTRRCNTSGWTGGNSSSIKDSACMAFLCFLHNRPMTATTSSICTVRRRARGRNCVRCQDRRRGKTGHVSDPDRVRRWPPRAVVSTRSTRPLPSCRPSRT